MIPELGHYALVLALVMGLEQASLPMVGAARGIRPWMQLAKPAALAQFAFVAFAFVAAGAVRLARFNTKTAKGASLDEFEGLPIPVAA